VRVSSPPEKPLVVFDGDCGFCRGWVVRFRKWTGEAVDYAPSQEVAPRFPEISPEAFERSVQLVEPDGRVTEGAEAVCRALSRAPGKAWLLRLYERSRLFAGISERTYRLVASHRTFFSEVQHLFIPPRAPTYVASSWLFLRVLGAIYLIAFVSFWVQADGLIGEHGVLPISRFLAFAAERAGASRFTLLPTLSWLFPSDGFVHLLCGGGVVLSILLVLGMAPPFLLFVLWAFYLSVVVDARDFLGFQWDVLLLETGFLAIFLAPPVLRHRLSREQPPSRTFLWLLRFLLFRLMFLSGAVKLASHDPMWRHLTALRVHYETQPLPTWIGWWAHQLPASAQRASTVVMFGIELGVPFLIFSRRLRRFAFGPLVLFQLLIGLTGNYAFFNLLTVALALLLLDDDVFPPRLRARLAAETPAGERAWPRVVAWPIAAVLLVASLPPLLASIGLGRAIPGVAARLHEAIAPFRSVNGYGLFAVMTPSRPEIVVEGSRDGTTWVPYEFKWKPGDPSRRPRFVEPHQPRLDWQMWFAALGSYEDNPWFLSFLRRVLEGSPPVLRLLAKNPFPDAPPRYLRAVLYDYRFTDRATRRATGAWWRRERKGAYCPTVALAEDGKLVAADAGK
jgi:predicted DCC family thiol-disulfide oxidoreductase YuxK